MHTWAEAPVRTGPARSDAAETVLPEAGADIHERIYRAVFDGVMSHRLTPGTKLPEARLCELFGASRAVVRQVLQRLAHDHIVQLRPNRGAIVAIPTREETRQIFEARRTIEAAIVRLVVERASPADLQSLREQLHQEHSCLGGADQPSWARLASAYHLKLAALAGNPILQRYLTEIVSRCSLLVAVHQPPGNAACEHDEHERIVNCIAEGDAAGAVRLMEQHLQTLEQHLLLTDKGTQRDLAYLLGVQARQDAPRLA